jgi:peptide/nickel transport system substrate-binding protein
MPHLCRRSLLSAATAAVLPRFAIAQSDQRPVVTVAVQRIATSNTLDILNEASNVGTRHYTAYKEPLIDTDWTGDLALRPGLAESWRMVDPRTIELTLREGVRFHNGDKLTADDVVFTFTERLFGTAEEQAASPAAARDPRWATAKVRAGAKAAYPAIEKVEAIDSRTVRITNRIPDVTLLGRLSMRTGCIINARAHREAPTWFDWARKPIGTGPYQVSEYRAENRLILDAFDDYWGGRPPIRQLRFIEVPELASRINGLLAGEFDFACDITPDQIPAIERNPRFDVQGGLITNMRCLNFDKNFPALRDPRVRRAMSLALDRQAIIDSLWGGRTRVPRGVQYPFYGEMYIADRAPPAYDPALARKLLAEAGYKGEVIPYKLLTNYYTNQLSTAQVAHEMWKAVGLNVELQIKENWGQIQTDKEPRALNDNSMTAFFNDPISFFPSSFGSLSELKRGGYWSNPEVERLVDEMDRSTDMPTRRRAFSRILDIIEIEDPALIILHETANFTAKRRDIQWKPAKSFVMDFQSRNFGRNA